MAHVASSSKSALFVPPERLKGKLSIIEWLEDGLGDSQVVDLAREDMLKIAPLV